MSQKFLYDIVHWCGDVVTYPLERPDDGYIEMSKVPMMEIEFFQQTDVTQMKQKSLLDTPVLWEADNARKQNEKISLRLITN